MRILSAKQTLVSVGHLNRTQVVIGRLLQGQGHRRKGRLDDLDAIMTT